MKKLIVALTLLTLATPAFAEHIAIIGQRMKMHATQPGNPVSPRHIWPVIRYRYTGSAPIRVKLGWQVLNGAGAAVTTVEKTHWLKPGQTVSLEGPDFFDYSGARLSLRGYAAKTDGKILTERIYVPQAQQ